MSKNQKTQIDQIVVNWHICEQCNYSCEYCFAKYAVEKHKPIILDSDKTLNLLRSVWNLFHPDNSENPVRLNYEGVRLNIAGGEPLLHAKRLPDLYKNSQALGYTNSIITNASLLTQDIAKEIFPYIDLLGISVDSVCTLTNQRIGRCDKKGKTLTADQLISIVRYAKRSYPHLRIKVNTVVGLQNWDHDFSSIIENLEPDKWKIFRVLPNVNPHSAISDTQFETFVQRHHARFRNIVRVEDNSDMLQTYIMIDPLGRFYHNQSLENTEPHNYSDPITTVGAKRAFQKMKFNAEGFTQRY